MPTHTTIIGLTGAAGAGKDSVRQILTLEAEFYGLAFADPIRAMTGALLNCAGISDTCLTDRELKERPVPGLAGDMSPRALMQTLGTEWGRVIDGDFWLSITAQKIASLQRAGERRFVISDVRFPNEAEWVRSMGGHIWRIDRPGAQAVRAHASEAHAASLRADRVIDNSGTLEALWVQVTEAADDLLAHRVRG